MGRETTDFSGCMVHGLVGQWMNWAVVCPVMRLDVKDKGIHMRREVEGGTEDVEAEAPLVIGCQEPIAEWRIPSIRGIMGARQKTIDVLTPVEVALPKLHTDAFAPLPPRGACTMIDSDDASQLWARLRSEKKLL